MTIDRIGTFMSSRLLLSQLQRAEHELNESNRQVAGGRVSDTYAGYGTKTAALEAARSAAAKAEAHMAVAKQVSSRLDLQDTQLAQLSNIVDRARQAMMQAMAQGNGSALMGQMEDIFDQAITVLNAKDGSGYIYGGENDQTPPVTVTNLTDLAALPSVDDAFANGTVGREARIGENRTVQVGVLASDLAKELFTMLRDIKQFDQGGSGPFAMNLTPAQDSFLGTQIQAAINAHTSVNAQAAANGDRYQLVQNVLSELNAASTVYQGFVADIQDVDMGEAMARFNQNYVALQAALKISATMGQLSLMNFID
jgi:flagellar hook-associated protein 3 FlgL